MWKINITRKTITCNINLFSLLHTVREYNGIFLFSTQIPGGRNIAGFNPVLKIKEQSVEYHNEDEKIERPLKFIDEIVSAQAALEIGFLGYIAYDYKDRLEEPGLYTSTKPGPFPDLYFALFEHYFVFHTGSSEINVYTLAPPFEYTSVRLENVLSMISERREMPESEKKSFYAGTSLPKKEFEDAVRKTIDYIRAGDLYQANITRAIFGKTEFPHEELGVRLYHSNRIECGVFAQIEGNAVISTSPERFFKVKNKKILTSPIKGTIKKTGNHHLDMKNRKRLFWSEKDRAELAMIVDLLRNDISRICKEGSVRVKKFPVVKELYNVFHLVADIEGRILSDVSFEDIMRCLFPGGSISGCPKIRACQIIEELEKCPRGLYTGSFGYYAFNRNMDFNIMIRSLFLEGASFAFHVGGGITFLSDPEKEYEETVFKARNIWDALNLEEIWEERYCITEK
jgi:para-aminobenzoate synthetase component 1